jgi:hypothetical protein
MERASLLIIVGVLLLGIGISMSPTNTTTSTSCSDYDIGADEVSCEGTSVTKETSRNQLKYPTMAVGFVVGIVGFSIAGMED